MKVVVAAAVAALAECVVAANPLSFPDYYQSVTATFASRDDAAQAEMSIAPLPEGASRAFSTRWDDTSVRHVAKAEMLRRVGVRGSFYIIGKDGISNGTKIPFRDKGILDLIAGGNAIGNHTLTHPRLVDFTFEKMFEQIILNRIMLECDTDHAVISYASPYGWYSDKWLDPSLKGLLAKMLVECGLWVVGENPDPEFGVPEDVLYPSHHFSANDKNPDHDLFKKGLKVRSADADKSPLSPRITFGTHSWCDEAGNALQERWLRENCIRPDWAQMNDYEYGAYRYSAINGSASRKSVSGKKAVFTVRRFLPSALGDDIPLSVRFSGNPSAVECGGKALERGANGTWRLPHDSSRRMVCKVGLAENDGKCAKLPGVELSVRPDIAARKVAVVFANKTGKALGDIYGVVHLPPEFGNRRRTFRMESVESGKAVERTFDCGGSEPLVYPMGRAIYVSSVDFTGEGGRKRIWATAEAESKAAGILLPHDAAWNTPITNADLIGDECLREISGGSGPLGAKGGEVKWAPRIGKDGDAWSLVTQRERAMSKAEMGIARNKGAQAIALQFIAKRGVETTLFTNIMSYNGNAALFLNGSPIKLSGRKAVLQARPGVNRLVMRIPVVPGRYTKPIQAAVCENGRLGAPCGCVPFVCHGE